MLTPPASPMPIKGMAADAGDGTATLRCLNDAVRRALPRVLPGSRVMVTPVLQALPLGRLAAIIVAVREFDAFTPDNDPYGEHDFGALDLGGERYFWRDRSLTVGSTDPTDPAVTMRVLTIMRADEY